MPCSGRIPWECCLHSKKVFFRCWYTRIPSLKAITNVSEKVHSKKVFFRCWYTYTKIAIKRVLGRTGQLILLEKEVLQLSKLPDLGRDGACQRIFGHKTISGRLVYHCNQAMPTHLQSLEDNVRCTQPNAPTQAKYRLPVACGLLTNAVRTNLTF